MSTRKHMMRGPLSWRLAKNGSLTDTQIDNYKLLRAQVTNVTNGILIKIMCLDELG